MKRKILIVISLFFALIFFSGCIQNQEVESYKFGAVLPLTGTQSFYGEFARAGIDLAIEEINNSNGINAKHVEIIYEDSGGDRARAVTATQKLINADGVDALFTITPLMAETIAPTAEENKIPSVFISATNSFAENKKYVFKDYPSVTKICEQLYNQAVNNGHKKIALFGTNYETTALCKTGAEQAGKLAAFETYNLGESDVRTQLTKIKNSGSTALMLSVLAGDCQMAYKQIKEINLGMPLYIAIHGFACGSKENTIMGKELLESAYGGDIALDEENPSTAFAEFKKKLETHGWQIHPIGSALLYDAVMEMKKAYTNCQNTLCVTNNLRNLNYEGVSGKISYNGDQIVERETTLFKYENDQWKRVEN